MLIQMCKVFSINFILIRCGSVKYNYKTENVFAVCHMIRHTAKLADAAAGDARRQAAASTPRSQAAASTPRQAAGHVRRPRSPVPPLPRAHFFAVCRIAGHTAKGAALPWARSGHTAKRPPLIPFEPHTCHTHSDTHAPRHLPPARAHATLPPPLRPQR